MHSDDYDFPFGRGTNRPPRAEREKEGRDSDEEGGHGYLPSVSSVMMSDLVSLNTVSSITSPPDRYGPVSSLHTPHKSKKGNLNTHGSQGGTRSTLGREAARAGWEKRYATLMSPWLYEQRLTDQLDVHRTATAMMMERHPRLLQPWIKAVAAIARNDVETVLLRVLS